MSNMNKQQSGSCLTLSKEPSAIKEVETAMATKEERAHFENETVEYNPNDWETSCFDRCSSFPPTPSACEFLMDALFDSPTPGSAHKSSPGKNVTARNFDDKSNRSCRVYLGPTATTTTAADTSTSPTANETAVVQFQTTANQDALPHSPIRWSNGMPMLHSVSKKEYLALPRSLKFCCRGMISHPCQTPEAAALVTKDVIDLIADVENNPITSCHSGLKTVLPPNSSRKHDKTAAAIVVHTRSPTPLEWYPTTTPGNHVLPTFKSNKVTNSSIINSNGVRKAKRVVHPIATVKLEAKMSPSKAVQRIGKRKLFPSKKSHPFFKNKVPFTNSINTKAGGGRIGGGHRQAYDGYVPSCYYYHHPERNMLSNESVMQPDGRTLDEHCSMQGRHVQQQQQQQLQQAVLYQTAGRRSTHNNSNKKYKVSGHTATLLNMGYAQNVLTARHATTDQYNVWWDSSNC